VVGYALAFVLRRRRGASTWASPSRCGPVWASRSLLTLIGIVALGEPATALKVPGTALIVAGVVALDLSGGAH
jgi:drug/metabolite transporter (DMT)-like permease